MTGIAGKVVVITGASSGIGAATARLLAERGANVVLGARREERLEALAAEIQAAGGQVTFTPTDVTKRADLTRLVALATGHFGRLDVMVNNAGVAPTSRFDDLRVEEWDEMIDVNLRGTLYGIAATLPVFRQQGSGQIINVISTSGLRIVPSQGVYAATKNAVRTLTEALRQEAGATLRVTGISPGFVRTGLTDAVADPEARAALQRRMEELALSPLAVARAIAFAISQPDDVDIGDVTLRPTAQD